MNDNISIQSQIKVRIWGTGIGIGISRWSTAIVDESFIPKESSQPLVSIPSPTKGKPEVQAEEEYDEVPVKKSNSNIGRKRKGIQTEEDDYPSDDDICISAPTYNSETGEGDRPSVSLLSLPKFMKQNTSAEDTYNGSTLEFSPVNYDTKEKKPTSASMDVIKNFWKFIDDQNYFQPYSKKSHRMDDFALRDVDYGKI